MNDWKRCLERYASGTLLAITAVATLACGGAAGPADGSRATSIARLQEAENLHFNLRLEDARSAFTQVFEDQLARPEDRATAARRLATLAWQFDQTYADAHGWLDTSLQLEPRSFDTAAERVRVFENEGNLDAALEATMSARSWATTGQQVVDATAAYGRVALAQAYHLAGARGVEGRAAETARRALDDLDELIASQPGWLKPSRLALSLAFLLDDGESALSAWRSYHWVAAEGIENPLLRGPGAVLGVELPQWKGPLASSESRRAVIDALASSAFFSEAARIATDPRMTPANAVVEDSRTTEVVAYARFIDAIKTESDEYYRRRALGDVGHGDLERAFHEHGRDLWIELPWNNPPPRFSQGALEVELRQRFGGEIMWGRRSDAMALHYGHRIVDDEHDVDQYGRNARIRFVVLDEMVSNGYTTWFWDGTAATGGWVNDDRAIVQVRAPYAEDSLEAWLEVTDPNDRLSLLERIEARSAADDEIARTNPHAYLPGLALRLRLQAYDGILEELKERGLKGGRLQASFLREIDARSRASSVFAHEGRHALDRYDIPARWIRSGAGVEYRAKLSEVAFAPDPRLALLGGILTPNIGSSSSHGRANERVMRGLVDWMRDNASEIHGFDASRPHLPQLDLLTDDQLRAAFRSMDPWA